MNEFAYKKFVYDFISASPRTGDFSNRRKRFRECSELIYNRIKNYEETSFKYMSFIGNDLFLNINISDDDAIELLTFLTQEEIINYIEKKPASAYEYIARHLRLMETSNIPSSFINFSQAIITKIFSSAFIPSKDEDTLNKLNELGTIKGISNPLNVVGANVYVHKDLEQEKDTLIHEKVTQDKSYDASRRKLYNNYLALIKFSLERFNETDIRNLKSKLSIFLKVFVNPYLELVKTDSTTAETLLSEIIMKLGNHNIYTLTTEEVKSMFESRKK